MRAPSFLRVDPAFFIVGAQKGGTTSLYRYLAQHPGVYASKNKEINFFGDNYERGFGWYKQRFPSHWARLKRARATGQPVVTGEATPFYLFNPHAPRRIHAAYPRAKIIAMLRDPVDRAWSHHAYHVKLGAEPLDFRAAIAAEPERLAGELERMLADEHYPGRDFKMYSYLARGRYVEQLTRWYEYFDPTQVLILRSEDFFADPASSYREVQAFLGLAPHELARYAKFNPGKEASGLDRELRGCLARYFAPYNAELYRLIGRDMGWASNVGQEN